MIDAQLPLADPSGTNALAAATTWVQAVTVGTLATAVATLAVATIGLLMLGGRVPLRRGLTVVAGCFLIFGATTIAGGLMQLAERGREPVPDMAAAAPSAPPSQPIPVPPQPLVSDPYAGAAVPVR